MIPANTKAEQDRLIKASDKATSEDFEEHIENLQSIIEYLDDLVSEWKRDYDSLEKEQTNL